MDGMVKADKARGEERNRAESIEKLQKNQMERHFEFARMVAKKQRPDTDLFERVRK